MGAAKAPGAPSAGQDSFSDLMAHHGFAPEAVALIAVKPVLRQGMTRNEARARLTAYFDNYYIQFLALQLERYGFQLNRAFIPAAELNYAAGLIQGRHGNATLDTPHLVALLDESVNALMNAQDNGLLNWKQFFAAIHIAADNSKIRGQDIVKALIKSNLMHRGAAIENYVHEYRGRRFATLSMLQVMEEQLAECKPRGMAYINRFGQHINPFLLQEAKSHLAGFGSLKAPAFSDYVSVSNHKRLESTLKAIETNLARISPDMSQLHAQQEQLQRDILNTKRYGKSWKEALLALDNYLRLLAAPFA